MSTFIPPVPPTEITVSHQPQCIQLSMLGSTSASAARTDRQSDPLASELRQLSDNSHHIVRIRVFLVPRGILFRTAVNAEALEKVARVYEVPVAAQAIKSVLGILEGRMSRSVKPPMKPTNDFRTGIVISMDDGRYFPMYVGDDGVKGELYGTFNGVPVVLDRRVRSDIVAFVKNSAATLTQDPYNTYAPE